ncbi:MAG: response regulator transcription factor [Candidatus Faecousia sp.]|nr:response regulator transcription factor [Candidatus Faecousia sp.]
MALIYIVEDDENIREIEAIALKNSNYLVKSFARASEFYRAMDDILPDLVLLDVMLPDESGYEIVKRLRSQSQTRRLPVIMVTAKTSEMDMVKGLDDGADDYIKKPFSVMELLSRVKALLRRSTEEGNAQMRVGAIQLDNNRRTVLSGGKTVELTYKEYELLRYFMINAGMVLSREAVMRQVWGTEFEGETRTVDMHVKTLRQKLGAAGGQIGTVRNVGYVLRSAPEGTV